MKNIKINNLPDYAQDYRYIVITIVDDELWFYGAYNDYEKALLVARETSDRMVVDNSGRGLLDENT